jgi:hypothetical protein
MELILLMGSVYNHVEPAEAHCLAIQGIGVVENLHFRRAHGDNTTIVFSQQLFGVRCCTLQVLENDRVAQKDQAQHFIASLLVMRH